MATKLEIVRYVPPSSMVGQRITATFVVDCTEVALAQDDILLLSKLQKGQVIEKVRTIIDAIEDSTATFDVGIFTKAAASTTAVDVDGDGFIDGANAESAAGTMVSTLEANTLDQGYYVSGDTTYIGFTAKNAMDTAKIRVCVDLFTPEVGA